MPAGTIVGRLQLGGSDERERATEGAEGRHRTECTAHDRDGARRRQRDRRRPEQGAHADVGRRVERPGCRNLRKTTPERRRTVARWDQNGQIIEENLFYDLVTFMKQIGIGG